MWWEGRRRDHLAGRRHVIARLGTRDYVLQQLAQHLRAKASSLRRVTVEDYGGRNGARISEATSRGFYTSKRAPAFLCS